MKFPVALAPSGARPFHAVGFGLNTSDVLAVLAHFPIPGTKMPIEELVSLPGGQTATAMTCVSRLGWAASYVGRFGDDANGTAGRESLINSGVDIGSCVTVRNASNAVSFVLVDKKTGERTIVWSRHPGLAMGPGDVGATCVQAGRVLLVDGHEPTAARTAARYAREEGIPTVIDVEKISPGIEDLLCEIDVIITSESFPTALTGEGELGQALRKLSSAFAPTMVCATLGAKGSLALVGGTEIRTPGFDVDVVDTTGAGDVFRGGFIGGWLLGESEATVEDVLQYANAVAALSCRSLGARGGIPTAAEVETFLCKRSA